MAYEDNRTWFGKLVLPQPTAPVDYAYDRETGNKVATVAKPVNYFNGSDFEAQNNETGVDAKGNRVRQKKGGGLPVEQPVDPNWMRGQHQVQAVNPRPQELPQASYSNEGRGALKGPLPIAIPQQNTGLTTDQQEDMRDQRMSQIMRDYQAPAAPPVTQADPWKNMAAQLAQFSAARTAPQEQTGGFNSLTDWNALENAEKTRRWAMEGAMRDARPDTRAQIMAQHMDREMGNETARRGQDIQLANSERGHGLQARGQDMAAATAGQRIAADFGMEGVRGQRQLENTKLSYGLQGENQAAHDKRQAENAQGLERVKREDPSNKARDRYYESSAKLNEQRALDYESERELAKSPHRMLLNEIEQLRKLNEANPNPQYEEAIIQRIARLNAAARKGQGYADGGQVETPEQVMARIQAKYGVSGATPQAAPPTPAPRPQAPAPQQPQTWAEKLRNVATGGLDRRMQEVNKYAQGGQIFADDSLGGLKARLGAMQAMNNGASVEQAYGGVPTFGEYQFDDNRSVQQDLRTGAKDSYGTYSGPSTGYAQGGPIDVSGRQVLGEGTPKSDSLPAIIDGEHPAALSTEEFVMPVETVRHFGLAKLNKMVEQSRKGLDTGRKQA